MGQNVLEQILEGSMKPTDLPLETLREITNNFSIERVIGWGGFGTVYKGVLRNGNVAVKRIMSSMTINEKLFRREVDSLMEVNHQNVVRFLGFCSHTVHTPVKNPEARGYIYAEIRERLLCFEYISNGSLDKYITDELRGLDWDTRFQIIKGICTGLCYLHMEKHILHMDLKPANILLDNQMVPKITDFGLSRPTENSQTTSTNNFCSPGYAAPENMFPGGRMLVSSDIYSLGAIIIELVTGHKGVPDNHSNVLRRWRHRWKKSAREMQLACQKQVTKCIEIGLLCQAFDPIKRPFISNIVREIGEMESMNNHIKDADEPIVDQINPPYWDDDMLGIEPLELRFANFEHNNKQILSCSVELSNDTGGFIAFEIRTTSPLPYSIEPNNGIVGPQSKFIVDITMQNDMATLQYSTKQYTEDFIVRSIKVDEGLATEDINLGIFDTDMVDEVRLMVFDNQLELTCIAEEPKESKSSVDIVYQTSYPHVQSPMFSPVQARCDWSVLGNKNHQVIPSEVPARNIDHDYGGRITLSSSNQLRKDVSAQASPHDSHAVQFDFDTQSQSLPLKGLSRGYVLDDSVDAEDQHVREHSTQWGSGDSPNLASGLEEASPSYPYLPAVPEDPGSSFSESAKNDPLPGIEGLRITGEAFPGRELQASGFSTNGTTSCNFVWVRHLDDGSVKFIEGARQPNHLVTADDVDTLLAVEVQPLDDRKRKGDIVKVYANKQAKIACDPQTKELIKKTLEVGHVSYRVQLPVRFLDMWEPAVLAIKREGYGIKCNGQRGVVLMEKFQQATAINIPYGYEHATEFSIVSADGAEYTLQPAEDMLSRDTIVLVLRLFKSSSLSEVTEDDLLPGIEGLRIVGEAFPGQELQASGYSTGGTTSCNFEWVRHFEDGSIKFVDGARQPNYLVTADDVNTLLAIELQPLDDRKRKGDIVKVYANEQAKITCDSQTKEHIKKTLEVGHVSYQVQLPQVRFLDMWEPAVLAIKREGYSIKCNGQRGVVLMEKFQQATVINIPYGYERRTEFSIVSADGDEYTLQPADNETSRDTIVLVLRLFKAMALKKRRGRKKGASSSSRSIQHSS